MHRTLGQLARDRSAQSRVAIVPKFLNYMVASGAQPHHAAAIAKDREPALTVLQAILTRAAVSATSLSPSDPYEFWGDVFLALVSAPLRDLFDRFTRVLPRMKIPTQTDAGGSASFAAEGVAAPVVKMAVASLTLDVATVRTLSVLSRELFRFDPTAEATFMRMLRDNVSRFISTSLFDSTLGPTTARPAALTYGCNKVTSTGSTAAQIIADLNSIILAMQTPMVAPIFAMQPKTFYRIAATLAGVGLTVTTDSLLGIPVVLLSGMPRSIVLLDCAAVFYASDDQAQLSVSTEGSLEMSDAPSSSGIAGTGATQVSLFQSGLVGIAATLETSWAHAFMGTGSPTVPAGCVFMTTSF